MPQKQAKEFGFAQQEGQIFDLQEAPVPDQSPLPSPPPKKNPIPVSVPVVEKNNEADETFVVDTLPSPEKNEGIILNIAEAQNSKILIRPKKGSLPLSGNRFIDTYRAINAFFVDHTKISIREKATVLRLLGVMLNAGLPLIKSLNTLAIQSTKNPRLSRVLFELAKEIEGGSSLSEAMAAYPDVFDEAQIGVVKAGEASGQLNKTLKSLAKELEKTASVTGKIKGALIYPIVILSLLIAVIFLLMVMVVPQITKLFTETGATLPLPTQILIGMSDFFVNWWAFIIFGVAVFIGVILMAKKTHSGKYLWDFMLLKLPIFGMIFQKGALSKFARGLSHLLSSGVPIIQSLEIVAHSIGNDVYKRRLLLTAEDMKKGIPMAENMSESKLFPSMLVNMIEVGEQTAQLETVTVKVAEFYDEEIDVLVQSLTKVMEPLVLVIIGVTIGGVVAAIMLPIIQLTNVAGTFV